MGALVHQDSNAGRRRRRLRDFEQIVVSNFVRPFLEQAAEEKNPRECVRLTNLAEILRTTHVRAAVSDAKLKAEIIRAGVRGQGDLAGDKELLKFYDVAFRYLKEVRW